MYRQFFGLRKYPFNMTPDPDFLYITSQHLEALAGLSYAVQARRGFVVLTGEAGTGKTTLVTRLLRQLSASDVQSAIILNPTLTPSEFLEAVLLDFGFTDVPASKTQRILRLRTLLLKGHEEGKTSVLVVDEAHKLSPEVLEEIRLLGNLELADQKLLQVALIGQGELDDLLNRQDLRQFKQRVGLRLSIGPLEGSEIEHYLRFRWVKAGGVTLPFSVDVIDTIAEASHGIPRVINAISDNALVHAFAEESAVVQVRHVRGACKDLHLPDCAGSGIVASALTRLRPLERYSVERSKPSLLHKVAGALAARNQLLSKKVCQTEKNLSSAFRKSRQATSEVKGAFRKIR